MNVAGSNNGILGFLAGLKRRELMNFEQTLDRYTEITKKLAIDDFTGSNTNWSEKELQMKLKYEILFQMKLKEGKL